MIWSGGQPPWDSRPSRARAPSCSPTVPLSALSPRRTAPRRRGSAAAGCRRRRSSTRRPMAPSSKKSRASRAGSWRCRRRWRSGRCRPGRTAPRRSPDRWRRPPASPAGRRPAPGWRPTAIQWKPGQVQQQRQQHPADQHRLAADPVAEPAEEDVERRADQGHDDQQQVDGRFGHAERAAEEHLHVEEGAVPDGALRAHDAEEGDQHALEILALPERLAQRRLADVASSLSLAKAGLSDSLKRSHTETISSTSEARNGIRHAQSRNASSPSAVRVAEDHQQARRAGRTRPTTGSIRSRRRGGRWAHARRRRSPRRHIRRRAPGPGRMRRKMSRIGDRIPAVS